MQAAAAGWALEDLDDGRPVFIFPENETSVAVFIAMGTQWRVAMGGPIGLDYAALPTVMRFHRVPVALQADTFDCVQILESEALKVMGESRG